MNNAAIRPSITRYGMTEIQFVDVKATILHMIVVNGLRDARQINVNATHQVRVQDDPIAPLPSPDQARELISFTKLQIAAASL